MPADGEVADAFSFGSSSACATSTSVIVPQKAEKDPRKMARAYQLELCKKAMEENIIVYLGTGCGKTHIAVLLIYELGHLIREPQRSVCIFLAPTVALVHQQAKVIEESTDFKVVIHCGSPKHMKSLSGWEKEIEQHEVLVMTPQVLLHGLSHSIIKMELIALLIFDECHHAQVQSSHPYAQIMKVFYKPNNGKNPRIFGMTASPVVGKGASSQENLPKSINSLENILDAKVYSVEDDEQLERFVATPVVKVYLYGPVANSTSGSFMSYYNKLEGLKRQCLSEIGMEAGDHKNVESLRSTKKSLIRMHENIMFCLKSLGVWGALQVCRILLGGDHCERNAMIEAVGHVSVDHVHDRYLNEASSIFTNNCTRDGIVSDISCEEVLKEPFFSEKLLRLIGILSTFRLQPNMKCIVFVNRIVTARSLACILQNLKFLTSWKCDFLVGVHSGVKNMSRKIMNSILEKFRDGKLNLLVATNVGEEGLDIQTCCLVIRFDLPETVSSFIQSRGRARMPQSEYVFLVDSGNQTEVDLIEKFEKDENRMNMEIFSRTCKETFASKEEPIYKVEASGASISSGYSISLVHHYCAKLPHDEFFDPKPKFNYFDDLGGTVCLVNLPCNAPIHQVASTPQSSMEAAKKDACLKAIEQLHKLGALNDFLLPGQDAVLESEVTMSDSNISIDENSRGELHEMMVPTVLKESWTLLENLVYLHSYDIKFFPVPEDRIYKKFALFVKVPLPQEAERMELDLHLARGRSVFTKLVPSGISAFTREEIVQAMNFQEMFLTVILDRSKLVQEFVLLGNNGVYESCPTFYLLLPILDGHENRVVVDRETVKRCLSSPIFRNPVDVIDTKYFSSDPHLQMANGCQRICDIEKSLVYAKYRNTFYFVTNTIPEKNGHSPLKGSSGPSHMEHLIRTFDIQLKSPEQPLLRAKPLFCLHNLLHSRRQEETESHYLDEFFIDLVPELCELKIKGFSKDIGSSISLLPSVMHRLENLLVAIELKALLSSSFSEAAEVPALRILEALTTERCQERFSLESLEVLGDAFLKFAVSRHLFLLHDTLDEGELTRRRSNIVNNSNLFKLAVRSNLQVYIRDQPLDPCQFFALGYPCPRICSKDSEAGIHHECESHVAGKAVSELRCSKGHQWLQNKTVADVVEALVGAFVVDCGFKAAIAFLRWMGVKVDFETSQVINACQASAVYMPLSSSMDIANFEKLFGYQFLHKGLLLQAFVHPSFNNGGGCYQRLEFLGDAALDYLITSYLFSAYPKLKPGLLTDLRSASVNNRVFATVAVEHSFDKFLMCDGSSGLSEAIQKFTYFFNTAESERGLLDEPKCPKVLSDLVESCMGAISLDTGFNLKRMWKVMISLLDPRTSFSNLQANPVREMNEICQSWNWENHVLAEKKGRTFFVEQRVVGKDVFISAAASNANKKEAIRITSEKIYMKLKDQGYIPKTNYLENFVRTNQMMEAKLIGYDEIPVEVVVPDAIGLKSLKIQESFVGQCDGKIHSIKKVSGDFQPSVAVTEQAPSQLVSSGRQPGGSCLVSARSRLYEICTANCWKSPLFECCCEEGPNHLKCFTYKVIVEIEEAPDMIMECVGAPQMTKKAAAEHAAKGALWYLERRGYLHQNDTVQLEQEICMYQRR